MSYKNWQRLYITIICCYLNTAFVLTSATVCHRFYLLSYSKLILDSVYGIHGFTMENYTFPFYIQKKQL